MTLDRYQQKRDFRKTPEPRPVAANPRKKLAFVIQKHHASHLHYDFRLELDGVLKSWAVPKGPSLDPAHKRLAVHVEDHPLAYRHFEGEIPQHQYGAGSVVIWDRGQWFPVGDPHDGYRKGNLKFRLDGIKLSGNWALVRMGAASPKKENWLLIKEHDAAAASGAAADITALRPESVAGSPPERAKTAKVAASAGKTRTVKNGTATGSPRSPTPAAGRRQRESTLAAASGAIRAPMPELLKPQLAMLASRAPEGHDWLCEAKFDGYRTLCRIEHGQARLLTRAGNDWSNKWPVLTAAAADLPVKQAWLDGEVVAIDERGAISFQLLQNAARDGAEARLAYYLFDLMYLDGYDLRATPLLERKQLLQGLLGDATGTPLMYSDFVQGDAAQVFAHACLHALEGIVVKRADAGYVSARSNTWLKLKCLQRQEFVIGGYTEPAGSREKFGALLLGVHEPNGLRYAGRVGTGFSDKTLRILAAEFNKVPSRTSPFSNTPGGKISNLHWLQPKLVAEVQFAEWTEAGLIRHASFLGLRADKPASEITREPVADPEPASAAAATPRAVKKSVPDGSKLRHRRSATTSKPATAAADQGTLDGIQLTHPSRILFPEAGISKLDLARYYHDVADLILPHLAGRPLTLVRCPQGHQTQCFFQKHTSPGLAPDIEQIAIPGREHEPPYMMVNSLSALISLVQIGVLELHTWGACKGSLDKPDRIIFDLDPAPGVHWMQVVEAAQLIHALMTEIGLASFVKTTGGKGLHVVIPLRPEKTWDEVKAFSRAVAEQLEQTFPDRFTAKLTKAKRVGKIFVDYLRNAAEATAVAAYSTRARPGAPVSVPIDWDELGPDLHSDSFNLTNVRARLQSQKHDPWAGYFSSTQRLTAKMLRTFA